MASERDAFEQTGALLPCVSAANASRIAIKDWSQTGRGVHIDFDNTETVPLELGRLDVLSFAPDDDANR